MLYLSEQGLYFFLARSDKPTALPFQKWLAGDVLPTIRKHGGYLTPSKIEDILADPDTIIKLATDLKADQLKRASLEEQTRKDRPKVIFADAVDASHTSILIGDMVIITLLEQLSDDELVDVDAAANISFRIRMAESIAKLKKMRASKLKVAHGKGVSKALPKRPYSRLLPSPFETKGMP